MTAKYITNVPYFTAPYKENKKQQKLTQDNINLNIFHIQWVCFHDEVGGAHFDPMTNKYLPISWWAVIKGVLITTAMPHPWSPDKL